MLYLTLATMDVESIQEASSPAKPLVDGLLVTGGTGLQTLSANWVLLVALDAQLSPPGLAEQIQKVRSTLDDLCDQYGISQGFLNSWVDRLTWIDPTVQTLDQRYRRGLLDIGGLVSHGFLEWPQIVI